MEKILKGLELKKEFSNSEIENLNIKQIANNLNKGNNYIKLYGNDFDLPLIRPILSQNLLFSGSIGSGKTNAIMQIVDQILKISGPLDKVIIFDSKQDFYNEFYNNSNIKCEKLVLSNDKLSNCSWNIVKEALYGLSPNCSTDDINQNLAELCQILFEPLIEKDKNNPFFPIAAKNIFYAILKVLINKYYIKTRNPNIISNDMIVSYLQKNINDIVNDFMDKDLRSELMQYIDYLGIIDNNGFHLTNQGSSVLSTLRNFTSEIFIGNFAKKGTFSIKEFIMQSKKQVIFIEYDIAFGKMLSPIYKTIIDYAIKQSLARKIKSHKTYFIIDEFRLLPKMTFMDQGVNFGRSIGTRFILGIQNIEQIDYIYSKELSRSILSGFLNSICFRTTDEKTRTYIKSLFGKNTIEYDNISLNGGKTRQEQDVILDHDILKLNVGQAIVLIPELNKNPILFKFLEYDKYKNKLKR